MRSVFLLVVLFFFCPLLRAQPVFSDQLIAYQPAPGQFINESVSGSPSAALGIIKGIGNPLSLGAYGGYVVLGFNTPVVNHSDNPYGIDFIIYGNATPTHSEPGIIMVMRDDNHNGIADDTWYEIAGSAHFTGDHSKDYSICYRNPKTIAAADVPWTDSRGNTGKIFKNSFHSQPYYPLKELFPDISFDNINFSGPHLTGNVVIQNGTYASLPYAFGYADNTPVINQIPTGVPDNPYTFGIIEGDGGDAVDISWAVDEEGKYVDLPEISFIRIATGVNGSAGWLGEISTEIRGITDVAPNKNISGNLKMILPSRIPDRIALYNNLELNASVFISGRPAMDEEILWESTNPLIAEISDNHLVTKGIGDATIKGSLVSDPKVSVLRNISVVVPGKLNISKQSIYLKEGETTSVSFSVLDVSGQPIIGVVPEIVIENQNVAELTAQNGDQFIIQANGSGNCLILLTFPKYPNLSGSLEIHVSKQSETIRVSLSVSNETRSILPSKIYTVGKTDISSFTDRYQKGAYSDMPFITLADALASIFKLEENEIAGLSLAFRQDEFGGDGLYVWQVGYDWEYQYGWGGCKRDDIHAKTWFAVVNSKVFASGFDTIKISDGDHISLRRIEDNRTNWSFVRIIPAKEDAEAGEIVNFQSEQLDFYPETINTYSVSGPFPVVNAEILADETVLNTESDQVTSFTGAFSLSFNQTGIHTVSLPNSESVSIKVMNPLSVQENDGFEIYPNPCERFLNLRYPLDENAVIRIFSTDGELKMQMKIDNTSFYQNIDLNRLNKGVYIIEFSSYGKSLRHKLCKL